MSMQFSLSVCLSVTVHHAESPLIILFTLIILFLCNLEYLDTVLQHSHVHVLVIAMDILEVVQSRTRL